MSIARLPSMRPARRRAPLSALSIPHVRTISVLNGFKITLLNFNAISEHYLSGALSTENLLYVLISLFVLVVEF